MCRPLISALPLSASTGDLKQWSRLLAEPEPFG